MEIDEIMKIDVSNLAETQFNALKKHVIEKLVKVADIINRSRPGDSVVDKVEKMVSFSPAGDGYGLDNHFIDFGYGGENLDVIQVAENIEKLGRRCFTPDYGDGDSICLYSDTCSVADGEMETINVFEGCKYVGHFPRGEKTLTAVHGSCKNCIFGRNGKGDGITCGCRNSMGCVERGLMLVESK